MIVLLSTATATNNNKLLDSDKLTAYEIEQRSWASNNAATRVMINNAEFASNETYSHVVYCRKIDGTSKARIVPWAKKRSRLLKSSTVENG